MLLAWQIVLLNLVIAIVLDAFLPQVRAHVTGGQQCVAHSRADAGRSTKSARRKGWK